MSTSYVTVNQQMSMSEILTLAEQPNSTSEADRTLKCTSLNQSATLGPTTTPKVDKPPIYRKIASFPGAALIQIDLTAAPGLKSPDSVTRAVDLTGAKLKHLVLRAGAANNSSGILIAPGSTNPYPLFGATKTILLLPGEEIVLAYNAVESQKPAVSGTVKYIDLTPSAAADVLEIGMAFGT